MSSIIHTVRTNKKGFTLIEILIVVGIIGLLASVVLSGLGSVRGRGRDTRRVADLRQVQQGLELYYTRCQRYPGGPATSGSSCGSGNPTTWQSLRTTLTGSGLGVTSVPSDPIYSDDSTDGYKYAVSGDGQEYILQATLEDEQSPILNDSYRENPSGFSGGAVNCTVQSNFCIKF